VSEKPGPDPQVEPEDVLRELAVAYQPVLGTAEIAERVGVSRQAANKHLKRYMENGWVDNRKIGNVLVWWITDDGKKWLSES
jgi:predicted transcriptional regulator